MNNICLAIISSVLLTSCSNGLDSTIKDERISAQGSQESSDANQATIANINIDDDDLRVDTIDEDEDETPPTKAEEELIHEKIIELNAPFKDTANEKYTKLAKKIPDLRVALDSCISDYSSIFEAHTSDSEECSRIEERLTRHKYTLLTRCLRSEFHTKTSDEVRERLKNLIPLSVERINRKYRQAAIAGCNIGDIPDQSDVNYTFNSSVEMGTISGSWQIKQSSEVPGWRVRFYDKSKGINNKDGYLEIQSNNLFRKDHIDEKDNFYMELDSHCPTNNCETTNVSIRQRIAIDEKTPFSLTFDAKQRRAKAGDSEIEVYFYKAKTKLADRVKLTGFEKKEGSSFVKLDESVQVPSSHTSWNNYKVELGSPEPGYYFVEIIEVGESNGHGTLIDNIKIER